MLVSRTISRCVLAGGFALAQVAAAAPLDLADAKPYGAGFTRNGSELTCSAVPVALSGSAKQQRVAGVFWNIAPRQTECRPVRFGAEGLADEIDEVASFCVYVDVTFSDGSHQWGVTSHFDPVAGDWHRREVLLHPRLPIHSLSCYLMARGQATVRFRAPTFETLPPDERPLLDDTPLSADLPPRSGFFVRDVAAKGDWTPLADDKALGCDLSARERQQDDAHIIEAVLKGGAAGDRAISLAYAVHLPSGMQKWFDSPRRTVPLSDDAPEQVFVLNPVPGKGLSAWPFGAVETAGRGCAIGIDPSAPAVYRVVAVPRSRRLFIVFDVGLVPEKPSARVRFAVFPFVAADGFRGALESYQALFPEAHKVRALRQGNWMAFHSISNLPHHEDFGFRFKEGTREKAWDDAHGIYTFHYEEPSTWWMKLGKPGEGVAKVTRAACAARAEALAVRGDAQAKAWLACAVRNARGARYGEIRDTPWCNGIVWSLNCAPGLAGDCTEFGRKWSDAVLRVRYGDPPPPFPQGLDGEYLDSATLPTTCPFDFDRTHFAAMALPLAFTSGEAPRVGIFKGLMAAECVAAVARVAHARGRLAMANSTPTFSCLLAFSLDVMGTETNWKRGGEWLPMPDAEMIYRRAVCGGKPFCFLQNTDFTKFSHADAERYMQRCLAYGMFPSFFSANAATGHYFSQPALYERDRPLFRKYLPLVTAIAEAGWRPVNRLFSVEGTDVFAEQFGDRFVTVFNVSSRTQRVRLVPLKGAMVVQELVAGGEWTVPVQGLETELPPETCRLYRLVGDGR